MKKLIGLLAVLFVFVNIQAQTNYTKYDGNDKIYFGYVSSMGDDSTGNFYSEAISLSEYTNSPLPLPISFSNASSGGTPDVSWSVEFREYNYAGDAWESWTLLDSISSANSTETLQTSVAGAAGHERPTQVRLKADGQEGNPSDVVLKWWIKVRED